MESPVFLLVLVQKILLSSGLWEAMFMACQRMNQERRHNRQSHLLLMAYVMVSIWHSGNPNQSSTVYRVEQKSRYFLV